MEILEEDDIVLKVKKRLVETKSYSNGEEFIFKGKNATINELKRQIINYFKLNVSENEIDLAKYYVNEWKRITLNTIQNYYGCLNKSNSKKKDRKKKGIIVKNRLNILNLLNPQQYPTKEQEDENQELIDFKEDLKKLPYKLKDGDEIGYRLKSEDPEGTDDFQTELDQENMKIQTMQKNNKDTLQSKNYDDNKGFVLHLNFEDDKEDENFIQQEKDDSNE